MTLIEAINHVDSVNPNTYSQQEKVYWLSTLDGVVKREIIDTHEGSENVTFEGYNDDTLLTTVLLIPAPYDEAYVFYLAAQIDYWNREIGKYNNSIAMFNSKYNAYEKYYNRTHMPISKGKCFRFGRPHKTPEIAVATEVAKVSIEED